jgi:hypothetical protein
MNTLNAVRKKRIIPEFYQDLTAASKADAIAKIRRTKDNEMLFSNCAVCRCSSLNAEGTYANTRTFSKVVGTTTVTLSPTSHMWTMPFPKGATDNPGNGTITQNVDK